MIYNQEQNCLQIGRNNSARSEFSERTLLGGKYSPEFRMNNVWSLDFVSATEFVREIFNFVGEDKHLPQIRMDLAVNFESGPQIRVFES
jgi:hypothetical protein